MAVFFQFFFRSTTFVRELYSQSWSSWLPRIGRRHRPHMAIIVGPSSHRPVFVLVHALFESVSHYIALPSPKWPGEEDIPWPSLRQGSVLRGRSRAGCRIPMDTSRNRRFPMVYESLCHSAPRRLTHQERSAETARAKPPAGTYDGPSRRQ